MNRYKLEEICDFYAGTGFPTMYQGNQEGKYPFYKVGDISKNALAGYSELTLCDNYIDDDVLTKIKGNVLPPHTVVFAKIGEALKLNRRGLTTHYCLVDNNVMGISPHQELDYKYFYHFMKTVKMQDYSNATTLPAVKKSEVGKIEINVPSLPEQQKIAAHLDSIQSAIDNKKQQLQQLDELVKSKFVEMFGNPVENEKNWTKKKLKETSKIITGNTPPRSEKNNYGDYLEWIKTDNITEDVYITKALEYLSSQGEKKGRIVEAGAILMACIAGSLSSIGRVALTNRKVAFNQQINAIIPSEMYNSYFLYILFNLSKKYTQSTVQMALKGILSKGKLEELEYIVPPIELQNTFAEYVQKIDSAKSIIKTQLADLQELIDSKMNEYFGE